MNIRKCTGLKELSLANNRIVRLTNALGQLSSLTSLRLDGNELTELPTTLGIAHQHVIILAILIFIGALHGTLTNIQLDTEKVVFPEKEILEQGPSAIMDFLKEVMSSYELSYRYTIQSIISVIATLWQGFFSHALQNEVDDPGSGECWQDNSCKEDYQEMEKQRKVFPRFGKSKLEH